MNFEDFGLEKNNNFSNKEKKSFEDYEDLIDDLLEDEENIVVLGKERIKSFKSEMFNIEEDDDFEKLFNKIKNVIKKLKNKKPFEGINSEKFYNENSPEACDDDFQKTVKIVIEEAKNKTLQNIGSGMTADVCISKYNLEYCFKIIKTDKESIDLYKQYNDIVTETSYLDELSNFQINDVRTPLPYCYDVNDEYHVLVMETLDAVSLDDLFSGRKDLPASYDENTFFNELEEYIDQLNKKGIYHFDLHAGNIMIDIKTGKARVIDFGKADTMQMTNQEGFFYQKNSLTGVASQRTKDSERIKVLKSDMKKYIYNLNNKRS